MKALVIVRHSDGKLDLLEVDASELSYSFPSRSEIKIDGVVTTPHIGVNDSDSRVGAVIDQFLASDGRVF